MSNSRTLLTVSLLALCTYACAFVRPNELVSTCAHRCLIDVTSGLTDAGYRDCFDECIESSAEAQQFAGKADAPASGDVTEGAAIDRKRSSAAALPVSWSKVFTRGVGSSSASKYLRIGRGGNDVDRTDAVAAAASENGEDKFSVDRRRVASSDRSLSSLTGGRQGNSAKSYLRVGKKSAENVDEA